jgi:hypothetical protein
MVEAVHQLAERAQVICLQGVTEELHPHFAGAIRTHQIFFDPGAPHSSAILVDNSIANKCVARQTAYAQILDLPLATNPLLTQQIVTIVSGIFHDSQELLGCLAELRRNWDNDRRVVIFDANFAVPHPGQSHRGLTYLQNPSLGFQIKPPLPPQPQKPARENLHRFAYTPFSGGREVSLRPFDGPWSGAVYPPFTAVFQRLEISPDAPPLPGSRDQIAQYQQVLAELRRGGQGGVFPPAVRRNVFQRFFDYLSFLYRLFRTIFLDPPRNRDSR